MSSSAQRCKSERSERWWTEWTKINV